MTRIASVEHVEHTSRLARLSRAVRGQFVRSAPPAEADDPRAGSSAMKARLLAAVGCVCEACRVGMPSRSMVHLHHITPVADGGTTTLPNLALLCPNCHAKAHWIYRQLAPHERPHTRSDLVRLLTRV